MKGQLESVKMMTPLRLGLLLDLGGEICGKDCEKILHHTTVSIRV